MASKSRESSSQARLDRTLFGQPPFTLAIAAAGASVLFALLFLATRYGLGLSPDSTAYIKAAEGLITGQGWAFASVQWPPLYPFVLAIFGYLGGGDIINSARVLHALLIAINYILIAQLFSQYVTFRPVLAYLMAFLISLHEVLIWVDFYAWSEPLLISFVLVDFLLIRLYLAERPNHANIAEALLIGLATLAVMTRYVGINVALTNALVVFTFANTPNFFSRLLRAGSQVVTPAFLIMLWLSGHRAIDDDLSIQRTLQSPEINTQKLIEGLQNFGRWLYPSSSKFEGLLPNWLLIITGMTLLIAILIALVPLVQVLCKRSAKGIVTTIDRQHMVVLRGCAALFIILYLLFLIFIMFCYDKKIFLDNRFLSPIFIPTFLIIFSYITSLKIKVVKNTLIVLTVVLLSCLYFYLRAWLLINYFDGVEINARSNINKTVYTKIKEYPRTCQIYADEPWNTVLYFEPKVRWLPRQILFGTGFVNTAYASEVEALNTRAQIVLVEKRDDPIVNIINSNDKFQRVYDQADGIIWQNFAVDQKACNKIESRYSQIK
jgi:hypothetical protein